METETTGFLPAEAAAGLGVAGGFVGVGATLMSLGGVWLLVVGPLAGLAVWLFAARRARLSAGRIAALGLMCLFAAALTVAAGYLCGAAMDAFARGLFAQDG